MAASSVSPPAGPSSSGPAGTVSGPKSGTSVNGTLGGTVTPPPGVIPKPGPGRVTPVGTRGTEGPGRPPRMVLMSAGAPPRVPPEPGTGPRLVDSGTRAASGGAMVGAWASARRPATTSTMTASGTNFRMGRIMGTATLPGGERRRLSYRRARLGGRAHLTSLESDEERV